RRTAQGNRGGRVAFLDQLPFMLRRQPGVDDQEQHEQDQGADEVEREIRQGHQIAAEIRARRADHVGFLQLVVQVTSRPTASLMLRNPSRSSRRGSSRRIRRTTPGPSYTTAVRS